MDYNRVMRNKILYFSAIITLGLGSLPLFAQENSGPAPIFVTPYKQPTVISRTPTIVSPQNTNAQSATGGYVFPEYTLVDDPDPWAGTSFGRVTSELDYYDSQTNARYDQYNYMALLAQRGETGALRQVASYIQENGVFDPNKYNAAMSNAANGGVIAPMGATAGAPVTQLPAPTGIGGATQGSSGVATKRVFVNKDEQNFAPTRLHSPYDEDMADKPTDQKPRTNQPIFLR